MINGNVILKKLGKDKFCNWIKKNGHKFNCGIDLQYANLQEANLYTAKLQHANLQEADLRDAKLQRANLQEADLQEAKLQEANLRYANLQEANLQEANLRYANLQEANLQEANLKYANLQGANLQEANLQGANIDFSCLPLWCGSTNMIIDERIAAQLLYHAFVVSSIKTTEEQRKFINSNFHRILDGTLTPINK